jgi:hypothetical protein
MITSKPTRVPKAYLAARLHDQYPAELPRIPLGLALPNASQTRAQRSQEYSGMRRASQISTKAEQLEDPATRIGIDREIELESLSEMRRSLGLAVSDYEHLGPEFSNRVDMLSKFDGELATKKTSELPHEGQHHRALLPHTAEANPLACLVEHDGFFQARGDRSGRSLIPCFLADTFL